jgi:hypothetical protein
MRSQSKGIGSADNPASIRCNIHTIPALLHCASPRRDKGSADERRLCRPLDRRGSAPVMQPGYAE